MNTKISTIQIHKKLSPNVLGLVFKVHVENKIAKFSCCLIGQQTPNPKPKTNGLAWIKPYFYLFLLHMVA
jgi:hypothetical protein